MTAVDTPRSAVFGDALAPAPHTPPPAPNGWRASSKAERSWLAEPAQNLRGSAYFWNLIPGLGLVRVGQWLSALVAFSVGAAALYGMVVGIISALGAGLYTAAVSVSAELMARERIDRVAPAMLERSAAWQWRRISQGPDCPRCGVAPTAEYAFCPQCAAVLAAGPVHPTAVVRAADGFSFPKDPALSTYVSQHLDMHSALGSTKRRDHSKLKELAQVDDRAFEQHHGEFLGAYAEPLDPTILWIRSRQYGRLHDGTVAVEDLVRRARYADGRLAEVWDSTRLGFPEGCPSARHGKRPVDVPAKVIKKMAA